nr:hypothetical protein [Tanacetum cinerariifolium]
TRHRAGPECPWIPTRAGPRPPASPAAGGQAIAAGKQRSGTHSGGRGRAARTRPPVCRRRSGRGPGAGLAGAGHQPRRQQRK